MTLELQFENYCLIHQLSHDEPEPPEAFSGLRKVTQLGNDSQVENGCSPPLRYELFPRDICLLRLPSGVPITEAVTSPVRPRGEVRGQYSAGAIDHKAVATVGLVEERLLP